PEDDRAFLRIINTPNRGMGPAKLEKLGVFAQEHSISLLASCTHARLTHVLPSKAYATINEFGEFIDHYT
ncbi:ATP-dependent DNA helicase Rep, partial [Psychrobacter proteolyticus]